MVAAGLGTNAPGEDPGTEPEVLDAVKVALDLGNDLNAVDKNGETAMHGAAYKHVRRWSATSPRRARGWMCGTVRTARGGRRSRSPKASSAA